MFIFCYFYYCFLVLVFLIIVIVILVVVIFVIFMFVIFVFIFMSEPRARPPLISPFGAAVKIGGRVKNKYFRNPSRQNAT